MGRESYLLPPPPPETTLASPPPPTPTALAPGFRFHPTDEELVIYYLKRKVRGKPFRFNAITEVDVYKCEPWDLSEKYSLKSRDQEYYFFSALDRKYGNGARMNRATCQGYWKATGNDRPVRHESRTVGLKKTLVFHSGRAPDGKRTNWVMHEYRIVDEELEKAGVGATQDAFVLCRIFHKSNIGPPSGQRYAPFIEEEWDDDEFTMVIPGVDNREIGSGRTIVVGGNSHGAFSVGNNHHTYAERNAHDKFSEANALVQLSLQDTQGMKKLATASPDSLREDQNALSGCKVEKPDDYHLPCVVNSEDQLDDRSAPSPETKQNMPLSASRLPLLMYKRRRHNDASSRNCNASENSSRTTQDHSSSVTTAATTTTSTVTTATTKPPKTRNFLSAMVESSHPDSVEPKESALAPADLDPGHLDTALPPSCVKFIQDLQSEIHQVSIERDTLKFELMSAQAMINILQSRIDLLGKELNEVKGKRRVGV